MFIPRISKSKIYYWVRKYLPPCKAHVSLLLPTWPVTLNFYIKALPKRSKFNIWHQQKEVEIILNRSWLNLQNKFIWFGLLGFSQNIRFPLKVSCVKSIRFVWFLMDKFIYRFGLRYTFKFPSYIIYNSNINFNYLIY